MSIPYQSRVGFPNPDWARSTLSQICNVVRGASPRPAGDPKYFNGNFIPWLTVAALTNIPDSQLVVVETAGKLTEAGAQFSRTLTAGTVIIANSGATLGVAKILGVTCCANDGIAALLDLRAEVEPRYVVHQINSQTDRLRKVVATGNGQPNLNTGLIGAIEIDLPCRAEQSAISDALDASNALIDSLEQLLTKKRQIKQGAMQELLTGKRRLPRFHDAWVPRSMADLFEFSGGLSASRDQLGDVGACYLHYGDIHLSSKTYIDLDLEHHQMPRLEVDMRKVSPTALLQNGDVVFVDASEDDQGVSKHVVIHCQAARPLISGLHTIVARPRTDELVDLYKRYCFQAPAVQAQFRFYAVGTKVSGVSKGNIGKIVLSVPSPAEQAEIAACLSEIDTEICALEERITKARALKLAMAQALLTGCIRLVEPSA